MRTRVAVHASVLFVLSVGVLIGIAGPDVAAAPGGDDGLLDRVLEAAGRTRGICVVVGKCDGRSLLELAGHSELFIHAWNPDEESAAQARSGVDAQGLLGKRIVVEQGDLQRLPHASNTVDIVFGVDLSDSCLEQFSAKEVLKVLRPGGCALLVSCENEPGKESLEKWLQAANADVQRSVADGILAKVTKRVPDGIDEWSHWEHGPDNNPVSTDSVIKAPYLTQWLGLPYYIAMPAISTASDGRVFLAMGHIAHHEREEAWLNTLVACNGYNGTLLWTRKLPDGYLAHRSAFIATPDVFYMIKEQGDGCLLLDPETGAEKGRIDVKDPRGDWKWIALQDGILYVLVGKDKDPPETTIVRSKYTHWSWGELSQGYYRNRVPWGFGTTILAWDTREGKVLWRHSGTSPVDSRAMLLGGGRLYFYCPDSRTGCLDVRTGRKVWVNEDPKVRELINERGRGLGSTPGFRTTPYALYTPKALFFEAQTHMNIVAVSLEDGRLLWHRKKTTNNPNMLYVDDLLHVGIGPGGNILALDPLTGETVRDLGFRKRSCARLTATPDSFFCRGWPEGLTRYDRERKRVVFNGAFRPSCNDGVIAAGGLLYAGPWACDCNLSLMGRIALCSAGGFTFEPESPDLRLRTFRENLEEVASFDVSDRDWSTYRGAVERTASTKVKVPDKAGRAWAYRPASGFRPTAPTAAGRLVFLAGDDGKVRALDARTGKLEWTFATAGPVLQPPTVWRGRAFVGSGDGHVYALEAATGRRLWRFRAAPVERRIPVYGKLSSTWPVNTGVLVKDGVAYAGAGIIDCDGTYVYALDAVTGKVRWQNVTSGHLDKELYKGVSAQGTLTLASGRLWMAGGNVISPASYDIEDGRYVGPRPVDGSPRANRGEEIGVLGGHYVILGGRLQFSATGNVVNPGNFVAIETAAGPAAGRTMPLNPGKIPPAWDEERVVALTGPGSVPVAFPAGGIREYLAGGRPRNLPGHLWRAGWAEGSDTVSLVLTANAVVTVWETSRPRALATQWKVRCSSSDDGSLLWEQPLPGPAFPGGLLVDRDGRIVVVLESGGVVCFSVERV